MWPNQAEIGPGFHYTDVIMTEGGVSDHQPHDSLLSRLFRWRSKKASKLRVTGLCAGNSPATSEFPAQGASNVENVPFDDVIMRSIIFDQVYDDMFTRYKRMVFTVFTV